MVFDSPIWLMALFPLAALSLYLMRGRGLVQPVPFVLLWKCIDSKAPRVQRRRPPIWICSALISLGLVVLAAAKPNWLIGKPPIPHSGAESKVAITAMAARLSPYPQVMVRLENRSDRKTAHLTIKSGNAAAGRDVVLPASGQSRDEFIDFPNLGSIITAEISPHASDDAGSVARLVRQPTGVQIHVDPMVAAEVKRFVGIYAMDRAAIDDAPSILVSTHRLDDDQMGVWIAGSLASAASSSQQGRLATVGPLGRGVTTWPTPGSTIIPAGFKSVVAIGESTIVAAREQPVRQVWINADFRTWKNSPDFVVFFANVFGWLGSENQQYVSALPPNLKITEVKVDHLRSPIRPQVGTWAVAALAVLILTTSTWPRRT